MSAVSLPALKVHLNITTDENDVELQGILDAAESVIAKKCGPLSPTAVTSRVASVGTTLVLPITPVLSLTTVTGAATYDAASLTVDSSTGVVTSPSRSFAFGTYDVAYQAGYSTLPPDLMLAVKELARHLWRSQRGGTVRPGTAADPAAPGYLLPYMVAELIEPYVQEFGFA